MMKILISGATGFIGKDLVKRLAQENHELYVLSRNTQKAALTLSENCHYLSWSSFEQKPELPDVKKLDAIIHLAGETISKRWTWKQKKLITESRVLGTQNLIEALKEKKIQVDTFIGGSAIGYYGSSDQTPIDETGDKGRGFLSDVVGRWEDEVKKANSFSKRIIHFRTGVVLGRKGGAFEKMVKPFKMGVGGKIGDGKQVLSWIHKQDLVSLLVHTLKDLSLSGVVNAVAPYPVDNTKLTEKIVNILDTKMMPAVPKVALKVLLGEMSELVTEGAYIISPKVRATDFHFQYPTIKETLYDLLSKENHD